MKLLMISGDRNVAAGKPGAFFETLKELHTHFERIDILCPTVRAKPEIRIVLGNVYLHPATGSLISQPSYILQKGRELFKIHRHDVMTVHDYPPFYNGFGARWLKKLTGIPAVLELHHIVGWPTASNLQEVIGRVLSKVILPSHARKFDAVRVVNATVKKLLTEWNVPSDKLSIVPSFYLDHELITSSKHQEKEYDFVFCARLMSNKGLLPVIDALHQMPDVRLLIIGDGPLRSAAEAKAKDLGNRVTFTGWLPTHGDVLRHMASGRVFVMNSTSEGGPRAALEAMALGLPVLTTRVGVMPDVVTESVNGLFIDGSVSDLAAKTKKLFADCSRIASMGAEAEKVLQRFEKRSAIKAYADFLKSQVH